MALRPGESVAYVALLDEAGDTILTVPMNSGPLAIPAGQRIEDVSVEVNVRLTLAAVARRDR